MNGGSGAVPHDGGAPVEGAVAPNPTRATVTPDLLRLGILSHPAGGASATPPLLNLIEVVAPAAREIAVVSGAESCTAMRASLDPSINVRLLPVPGLISSWADRKGLHRRIANFALTQCRAAAEVGRVRHRVDLWIFYIDGQNQVLPILIARLFRRRVLLLLAYSAVETLRRTNPGMASGARVLMSLTCSLSDCIAVASEKLVDDWHLERWRDRVRVAHEHFIDADCLAPGPPIEERKGGIGFVGRFAAEKGIMEFLEAAERLHELDPALRFVVIGDGPLREAAAEYARLHGLQDHVTMTGWLPHETVREHLRELTLLVIPSYTESGPMVAYEALALGTPIVITNTGLVAGLLSDGVTGFLLDDPSPTSIVEGILRARASPSLDPVSREGRSLVSRELSLDRTRDRLVRVLLDVAEGRIDPTPSSHDRAPHPGEGEHGG